MKMSQGKVVGAFLVWGISIPATVQGAPSGMPEAKSQVIRESAPGTVERLTGSGVVDPFVTADASGRIATVWTDSTTPNAAGSSLQGAFALHRLTESGLDAVAAYVALPRLEGERTFMRPVVALAEGAVLLVGSSEDNGVGNGNPQPVAFVADLAGKLMPIANSTRGESGGTKPTNLITLSGKNDAQQYGTHSICRVGPSAFVLGVQRNNENAYAMRVDVTLVGGRARVAVPWFTNIVPNATHNRPQIACPPMGADDAPTELVFTSVEASAQPADIGVRAVVVDTATGAVKRSKLVAASKPAENTYAVQPSAAWVSKDVVAIAYQVAAKTRGARDATAHAGGENVSNLITVSTKDLTVLEKATGFAPYQRHAMVYGARFGLDDKPAVVGLGGSSTGGAAGRARVTFVDPVTGAITKSNVEDDISVARFSDVSNLPARGKRNPNDQGRGFLAGLGGVKNPGYGKASGFMNDVSSFQITAVAGYKDAPVAGDKQRESLHLTLVPATWRAPVTAANVVSDATPSTAVTAPPGACDPFATDCAGEERASAAQGCSIHASRTGEFATFAVGLGLVLLARRRARHATLTGACLVAGALAGCAAEEGEPSVLMGSPSSTAVPAITTVPAIGASPSGGGVTESARQSFEGGVYPRLVAMCQGCHGGAQAPLFAQADVEAAYAAARSVGASRMTSHRHAGAGVDPDASLASALAAWGAKETSEQGSAPATASLEAIGKCMNAEKFARIGFERLVTEPRKNEDADTCVGCNNVPCRNCHTGGDGGFYMAAGSAIDTSTFERTKEARYAAKYFAVSGAHIVASKAIRAKADRTRTEATHPMFRLPVDLEDRLDAFVDDAIVRFVSGTCP